MPTPNERPLSSILLFGATGRMSPTAANYITKNFPDIKLRLATSNPESVAKLQEKWPKAEVVVADYFDGESLKKALDGIEGVFVITPDFLDETKAMNIFAYAAKQAGTVRHVVRMLGNMAGVHLRFVSDKLKSYGGGTAIQHFHARAVLDASDLPITYINCAAYLMDNLYGMCALARATGKFVVPFDRLACHLDPRDIGEVAARILTKPNRRAYVGLDFDMDNGHDLILFSELAEMVDKIADRDIVYDGAYETHIELAGPILARWGPQAAQYYADFYEYESNHDVAFRLSNVCELILGRKPVTLEQWLDEHKNILFPPDGAESTGPVTM